MSEFNDSQDDSQDDPQDDLQEEEATFDRGTPLSIFNSDRREDFMALFFSLSIALGVYVLVN